MGFDPRHLYFIIFTLVILFIVTKNKLELELEIAAA